jgi:glycosyltransferase involved in cell wall biosynthesis
MKNHETLVESYAKLPPSLRKETKLVIIGDGPLKSQIKRKVTRLGIFNDVVMPGFVNEKRLFQFYRNCKFVVHLALHEPFGLIPIEAGFFGKPSIVSNSGGVKEVVKHGKTGLIINPKDTDLVADTLSELLLADGGKITRMGMNARKAAMKYTMKRSAKALMEALG